MKAHICCSLFFLFFATLYAQDVNWCGFHVSPEDIAERAVLQKEIEAFIAAEKNGAQDRSLITIPVKAHVFRRDDGTWGGDSLKIVVALEKVNEYFAQSNVGIALYLCGSINYIDNTKLSNTLSLKNQAFGSNNWWASKVRVPYALNLFISKLYYNDNGQLTSGGGFFPNNDLGGTVGLRDTVITAGIPTAYKIAAHEFAHALGLYHTFGLTNSCRYTTDELADGSNCKYTGDFICDTKATPCLGYAGLVDANCKYTGESESPFDPAIVDANGKPFNPDVNNMMSYSPIQCNTSFTPEQGAVMRFYAKKYFDFSGNYCGSLSDYCPAKGQNTDYGYIREVRAGGKSFVTGDNNGYRLHTNTGLTLERGFSQPFLLSAGGGCRNHIFKWRIFVDLNQDKDFEDSGELIYDSFEFPQHSYNPPTAIPPKPQPVYAAQNMLNIRGQLWIPPHAKTGATRMRISCKYTGFSWYKLIRTSPMPCETFPFGEVEDFDIEIKEPAVPDPYCTAFAARCITEQPCENGYSDQRHIVLPIYKKGWLGKDGIFKNRLMGIDFNQDNKFENGAIQELSQPADLGISIPVESAPGKTRLRITEDNKICGTGQQGKVTDYTAYVLPQNFTETTDPVGFAMTAGANRARILLKMKAGDIVTTFRLKAIDLTKLRDTITSAWNSITPFGILEKDTDTLTFEFDANNLSTSRRQYIYHFSLSQNKITEIVLDQPAATGRFLNIPTDTLFLTAGKDAWRDTVFRLRANINLDFRLTRNFTLIPTSTEPTWLFVHRNTYYADSTTLAIPNSVDVCANYISVKYQPNTSPAQRWMKLYIGESGDGLRDSIVIVQAGKTTTSTQTVSEKANVQVYPNPSDESFHINSQDGIIKKAVLINVSGQVQRMDTPETEFYTIEKIPTGVYFLRTLTESGWRVHKLVSF